MESNHLSQVYEACEPPLLYSAILWIKYIKDLAIVLGKKVAR